MLLIGSAPFCLLATIALRVGLQANENKYTTDESQ
jgi:hypothetical protein